jgi:biotin carboxyl carrier protein
MKYIVTINDKNYEVEVERGKASIVKTTQASVIPEQETAAISAAPAAPEAAPLASTATAAQAVSGDPVKAPMPGTILAVRVQQGAKVNKGDVLFILEAMKMENEVTAPRDGVVSQLNVAQGASVSTGDILLALQ